MNNKIKLAVAGAVSLQLQLQMQVSLFLQEIGQLILMVTLMLLLHV